MEALHFNSEEEEENYNSTLLYEDENEDEDEDDVCFIDGILEVSVPSSSSSPSSTCQVITRESLLIAQRADLRRVMDLLLVKEHQARTLLIRYQWNVERLITVFVEKGKAHLFAEAGATVVEHDVASSLLSSTLVCYICMEDVPCIETTRMDCGHTFCNDCWTEHFMVKINDGESRRVRCMAHQCNAICDEGIVRNLVRKRKPELAEKFDRFLLESYIDDNKMVKWCPSIPHCGNAIRIKDEACCEVECTCGLQFCFRCLSEVHSPCSCLMWEMWSKKCNDESETFKWINVHTKCCPTCGKPVEKNGGCSIVFCVCMSAFCWRCGNKYDHLNHSCTRYEASAETQHAKNDLHRYIHYYSHYKGHKDSIKLEADLEKNINILLSCSEANKPQSQDLTWVKNGAYRLSRSRHILSYSYVFAFYMFGNDLFEGEMTEAERRMKQNLFEDQQQQLEARVERLSDLMEKPFCKYTIDLVKQIRMQVIALTCTIDDLCNKMYDCIENDLLGSLKLNTHIIAPYESKGVVRASELTVDYALSDNHNNVPLDYGVNGFFMETGEPSSSRDSSEGQEPSEKRAKIEDSSHSCLDLNLSSKPSEDEWRTALLS